MFSKKFYIIIAFIAPFLVSAQQNVEIGLMLGGTNYAGEMTNNRHENYNFSGGLMIRYNPNSQVSLRGNIFYGTLEGDDKNLNNEANKKRNLNFTSPLLEFSVLGEWNIFGFDAIGNKKSEGVTPYLFAGLGIFKFNPKGELNGEKVELQPLGTEGQGTTPLQTRKKYALTQVSIPFGIGLKFRLSRKFVVGLEYGPRLTFTDYIDDVSLTYVNPTILEAQYGQRSAIMANRSGEDKGPYDIITQKGQQRGDNNIRDWYSFVGVTLSYSLNLHKVKCYEF